MCKRVRQAVFSSRRRNTRRAASVAELVVASVLFIAATSFVVTGAVSLQRVWRDGNHYRLAIDTLNNELEKLTLLDGDELAAASEKIEASQELEQQLSNVEIQCELQELEHGTRIALSLNWDRQGDLKPIELVGWSTASKEAP